MSLPKHPYAKAIAAFLTGLAAWLPSALLDGTISTGEWGMLAGLVLTTAGVALVPNTPTPLSPAPNIPPPAGD